MLQGSSVLSEFRTSLSKVLTLWHCVKVKQRYLSKKGLFYKPALITPTSKKKSNTCFSIIYYNNYYSPSYCCNHLTGIYLQKQNAYLPTNTLKVRGCACAGVVYCVFRSNHNYLFDDLVRTNGCSNRLRKGLNKKGKKGKTENITYPACPVAGPEVAVE